MTTSIRVREIKPEDNSRLASIIRKSLEEFNAAKAGTVYFDETTDRLFDVFRASKSAYFVLLEGDEILGGAGFYPTANLPENTCELVKLYLSPRGRGRGLGKMLLQKCEAAAHAEGYTYMYLETMPELKIAVPMYEKMGYHYLDGPLGNSGHGGCDIWMGKQLMASAESLGESSL